MAHPDTYRPAPGHIPTEPGVYRFYDENRRIIYVGKAKNLRSRLNSYFTTTLSPKTEAMVHSATGVEWTLVRSEVEALQLEYTWIKEFAPRYNVLFRDDKSYPYFALSMDDEYPRAQITRGRRRRGIRYFGPYSSRSLRETIDLILRVFPVRTCSAGVFRRAHRSGRPCLLGYIDKCSAPCVGRISVEEHRHLAEALCSFMGGEAKPFIADLERRMKQAVSQLDFEQAATLRDDIAALRAIFERNTVVLQEETNADFFALAQDELEAAVQVFYVRGGRIRGQRGWVVEKVEDIDTPALLEHFLQQIYGQDGGADAGVPRHVLVPIEPSNKRELNQWLSGLREGPVDIRVPQRGDKAELLRTVAANAEQTLTLHKLRRAGDLTQRSAALRELQDALGLPEPILRIECFDISHTQGREPMASMVVFEDGLAKKSQYRTFSIAPGAATDDTSGMYHVLTRRFRRYVHHQERAPSLAVAPEEHEVGPETGAGKKFAYPPSLLVIDGGAPQVSAAAQALKDAGVDDIPVIGLAKRLEEVWLPGSEFPLVLPRSSPGLYLLQRVRDEAHRFATSHHRRKRSKSMMASVLDEVPGVGEAKRKALIRHFGSVAKLGAARVDDIAQVPGFGPALAAAVSHALNTSDRVASEGAPSATPTTADQSGQKGEFVDIATGELLNAPTVHNPGRR